MQMNVFAQMLVDKDVDKFVDMLFTTEKIKYLIFHLQSDKTFEVWEKYQERLI